MEQTRQSHRTGRSANVVNVALGIWTIISPFVLGFARLNAWKWNNIAAGIAVTLVALGRGPGPSGAGVLNVLLGLWIIISAFAFVADYPTPFWNNVSSGALILVSALVAGATRDRRTLADAQAHL